MKTKMKRSMAFLLAFVLMLGALPIAASAATYTIYIDDEEVTDGDTVTVYLDEDSDGYYDLSDLEDLIDYSSKYYFYTTSSYSTKISDSSSYDYNSYSKSVVYVRFTAGSTYYYVTVNLKSSTSSSSSTSYDGEYYVVCASGDYYYFEYDDFEDPAGDYELDDYDEDQVYITISTLPSRGTLYYRSNEVTTSTKIYLSYIDELEYDKTSTTKDDSFVFTIYDKDSSSNIVKKATMYILNEEPDTSSKGGKAISFTKTYDDSDSDVYFSESDFTDHFTESDGGALKTVKIVSVPNSKYGVLYIEGSKSNTKVTAGKTLTTSQLDSLFFEYGSSFEEGVSFTYSVIDKKGYTSNTATIVFSNEEYAPIVSGFTVGVKKNSSITIGADVFTNSFYSKNGNILQEVTITSLPSSDEGVLYLSSSEISVGDVISASKLKNIKFTPASGFTGTATFTWNASDSNSYAASDATGSILVASSISMTAGDFDVFLDSDDTVTFTSGMFKANYVNSSSSSLSYIQVTSLPSSGTLYKGTTKVSKNTKIAVSDLDTLTYKAGSGFSKDSFEYKVSTNGSSYSSAGTVTINPAGSGSTSSSYTLTANTSAKTATLTFKEAKPDTNYALSASLSASQVASIYNSLSFTGGVLTIEMPATSGSTATSRSLSLDSSMFTKANVAKVSKIILIDASTNAVKLTIDTASVADLYSYSTAEFHITLERADATDATSDMNAGMSRKVQFQLGNSSVSLGSKGATLSIPYAASTLRQSMAVIMQRSGSSYIPLPSSKFDTTTGYLTANITENGTYLAALNNVTFSDVNSSNWAYSVISNLSARNVINGYTDGTFKPNGIITRAEYIKLLVEALGLYNSSATASFTDVVKGVEWSYQYVASAVQAGVIADGGTFKPSAGINRQDMALYSYLAARAAGITLPTNTAAMTFTDESSISAASLTAVKAMQRAGIINGYTDNTFKPQGTSTRAEASKIISMLMELYYA